MNLIFKNDKKTSWQILRTFLKQFKMNKPFIDKKNDLTVFFNLNKISNFKNFIHFHYLASKSLTNFNFYLNVKTEAFQALTPHNFKFRANKLKKTKIKYWLDDFFSGSKDEYSQYSKTLAECSKIFQKETSNFF